MMYYDRAGTPCSIEDYARSFELINRRVALTKVTGGNPPHTWEVSTVHLGLDHGYGDGPPLIFETMVFDPEGVGGELDRYSTEQQAREGHAAMVVQVAATMSNPVVLDIDPEDAPTTPRRTP